MRPLLAAITVAGALSAHPGFADEIRLTARDGSIELEGEFLSFDGEYIRLDSQYGVVTVDADAITCEGDVCPRPGEYIPDILISGAADGVGRLLPALLEAFAAERGYGYVRQAEDDTHFLYLLVVPEEERRVARIRFRLTTTGEGFADLIAEQADLVLALREPTDGERAVAMDAGAGDLAGDRQRLVLAHDALVAVVHPENPVRSLSKADLDSIVAGEVANWADVGGPDAPITLHLPSEETGIDQRIRQVFGAATNAAEYPSAIAVSDAVADDATGLGLTLFSASAGTVPVDIGGSCGFSVRPAKRNIGTSDYPFSFPVAVHVPGRRLPAVTRDFLAFLQSDTAQKVASQQGFAGRSEAPLMLRQQGDRLLNGILASGQDVPASTLRSAAERLQGAERLVFTFRFGADGTDLDPASKANLNRLAARIDMGLLGDGRLLLAGFTDSRGGASVNRALSEERAGAVAEALIEMLGETDIEIDADGFGEAMPVACDDDPWGTAANRRVEAWIVRDAPRP